MKKDFSETLKDLRIQAGYTQKQVYDLLGIRQSTFSAWETGRAEPSADMLLKLCKLYKVNDIFSAFGYDGYNEDGSIQLNLPEIELVENYRKLDPQGQEHVNTVLDWKPSAPPPSQARPPASPSWRSPLRRLPSSSSSHHMTRTFLLSLISVAVCLPEPAYLSWGMKRRMRLNSLIYHNIRTQILP